MSGSQGGYTEGDLLPLSALQHLVFCERQCALIHLEGMWRENALTIQGKLAHERVDEHPSETRGSVRVSRHIALRSFRLGLYGRADVVEFHSGVSGVAVAGLKGRWRILPIEHKRGKPKTHRADEVQLCAQAICLEEMLGATIERAELFYGKPRRRTEVELDRGLRELVERSAHRLHDLIRGGRTPFASYEPKCDSCSMFDVCKPKSLGRSALGYLAQSLEDVRMGVELEIP